MSNNLQIYDSTAHIVGRAQHCGRSVSVSCFFDVRSHYFFRKQRANYLWELFYAQTVPERELYAYTGKSTKRRRQLEQP